MKALLFSLFIMVPLSVCHAQISVSDSTVIQKILDDNGVTGKSVSDVVVRTDSLRNVLSIDLSNLGLDELPGEIGKLQSLVTVEVSNNSLMDLPPEIGLLSSLEDLNLSENNLTNLPPGIMNLENLDVCPENLVCIGDAGLDIRNNKLCDLPDSIENWLDSNWHHAKNPAWREWRDSQNCTIGIFRENNAGVKETSNKRHLITRGTVYFHEGRYFLNLKGQKKKVYP